MISSGLSTTSQALQCNSAYLPDFEYTYHVKYFKLPFHSLQSLCIGAVWVLFYGVLSGFAPNIVWLLILRFLVGIGVGAVPQA